MEIKQLAHIISYTDLSEKEICELLESFATQNYRKGYKRGKTVGNKEGYKKGYDRGHKEGYDKGWDDRMLHEAIFT